MLMKRKEAEEQRSQRYLKLLEVEKQEVPSLFKEMHEFLEEKERCWLMELAEVENEIKKRQEKNMTLLSEEISHFSELIKDVEVWMWKSQQPPSEFLQDIGCTLSRCQELQAPREKLELSPGLEWRVRRFGLKHSAFKRATEDFEGSLDQEPSQESITLDPNIYAHPSLFISENLKNVTWKKTSPEWYSPPYVLGHESFTAGRHFWEVNISYSSSLMRKTLLPDGTCEQWAAGVARESICSETAIRISPNNGMWTIGKDPFHRHSLLGNTSLDWTSLPLIYQPRKIRVFLDCEEGCVEFFDADTDDLIFAFPPASFSGEIIHPFFWLQSEIHLQC